MIERVFVYDGWMAIGGVEQLRAAIDALAAAEIAGLPQRDDLRALWRAMARLDAQFARRVGEFDRAREWSVDGSRSPAGWCDLQRAIGFEVAAVVGWVDAFKSFRCRAAAMTATFGLR